MVAEERAVEEAFQDNYRDDYSYCYGCGRLNEYGLQIKSYWDGEDAVCHYQPRPYHTAIPGYVYGGLIASLIDCHSTGTAAAAAYRKAGRSMGSEPRFRYVTASLHVDYVRPTPISTELEVRAHVVELKERKAVVVSTLTAAGAVCARGEVVVVQMPEEWLAASTDSG
ncbi:MAG: PaaI family thioesterase [Candidatus Promineifilaceae bacterium]|nr:PaaI family thioesterase [Candidatus Promineifilaceae bacterium]